LTLINTSADRVRVSTKFLIDDVITKHQTKLCCRCGGFAATLIQGATSYSLTQLLSKERSV